MLRTSWAELNRHIDVAGRRVAQQRVLVEDLAAFGRGMDGASELLEKLQHQLDALIERRRKLLGGRDGSAR